MFNKQASEEMEITAYERPSSYTVSCNSCGSLFVSTFRFLPSGEGTNVEVHFNCQTKSLFALLMSPLSRLMLGTMKKAIDKDLEDLKAVAERLAAEPSAEPTA